MYARSVFLRVVVAYVGGSALGGATLGSVVWLLAWPLRQLLAPEAWLWMLWMLVPLVALRDLAWRFPIPERRVQVGADARNLLAPEAGAFIYGLTLGFGLLTFITFASFFVLIPAIGAQADFIPAVALGLAFGFGRGSLPIVFMRLAPTPVAAAKAVHAMARAHLAAAAVSVAAAVSLAGTGVSP